jgi:hypothetical protein
MGLGATREAESPAFFTGTSVPVSLTNKNNYRSNAILSNTLVGFNLFLVSVGAKCSPV